MARRLIALTMEHGLLKLLVTQGRQVVHHRAFLASPQFFREGLVRDSPRVGGMIRTVLDELGVKAREAVGAVPGFQGSLRLMEFPRAQGFDAGQVIPRAAARQMGVSQENSVLTWTELDGAKDRTRWLVISAARRAIGAFLDTAGVAGLNVGALDLRPFALARAINRSDAVIAWVAPDGCDVVVVRNAVPVVHNSLFWGAEVVERQVLVYRLTEIIERTTGAYDAGNPDGPMPADSPLYVCGSPVGLDPLVATQVAEALQRVLGELAPPCTFPADFPVHDFIVNLGLGLRGG